MSRAFLQACEHHRAGRLSEAERFYRHALRMDPKRADAHNNLGLVLQALGQVDAAIECFNRALALRADLAELHCHKADALRLKGNTAEAAAGYRKAIALKPGYASAHHNLGVLLEAQGLLDEALLEYGQAREFRPETAEVYKNLGNVLQAQGKWDEAVEQYQHALRLRPRYAEAHSSLGLLHQQRGRLNEAIVAHARAVSIQPDFAEGYRHLGRALQAAGKWAEAGAAYRKAISLKPRNPAAYNDLGRLLYDHGGFEEAVLCYREALLHGGVDHVAALVNAGNALRAAGRLEEAVEQYSRALSLQPDLPEAHVNLSLVKLLTGEYATGWSHFEWRWQTGKLKGQADRWSQPQWRGQPIEGQRILLRSEQGLGDSLQFFRYVPMVAAQGAHVLLKVPGTLQRLARELPGVAAVIASGEPDPPCDWHCPLMSLPLVFDTRVESIPAQVPYLSVPADAQASAIVPSSSPGPLRVGIVWAGDPTNDRDRIRSVPSALFKGLFDIESVGFFSLQVGSGARELDAETRVTNLGVKCTDMADTAAYIQQLDLVISVDTSVAHLAGALGTPVWLLLSTVADWRWFIAREDSPWYSGMRIFRQASFMDWQEVFVRVHTALNNLATERL